MISLCLVNVLLSCCSLAPLPRLHPRLAVVVLEATHPIPPQYIASGATMTEIGLCESIAATPRHAHQQKVAERALETATGPESGGEPRPSVH
jgi:hypothetical protein